MKRTALFLIALICALPARAEIGSNIQRFQEALTSFEQLKAKAAAQGKMPRLDDPAAAKAIRTLSDVNLTFSIGRFRPGPETIAADLCGMPLRAAFAYILSGIAPEDLAKSATDAAAQRRAVMQKSRNIVAYQDEVVPLMRFSIHCSAQHMPYLRDFAAKLKPEEMNAIRRQGIAKVRGGAAQLVGFVVALTGQSGISETNRRLLLAIIAADMPLLAPVLKPEARAQLRAGLSPAIARAPDTYKAYLINIDRALDSADCSGLCAY